MSVGEAIKKARTEKGLSAQCLANKSGLSLQAIYHYEHGISEPRCWCLIALADALDISLDELEGRSNR